MSVVGAFGGRWKSARTCCTGSILQTTATRRSQSRSVPSHQNRPRGTSWPPYIPITDGFVLAAVERAELHEQEAEVLTSVLMAHLGFEWAPPTNRLFFPRLDELRQAGLLTSTERRGEPFWSLTSVGREQLAK